ncbi:MAG TPA: ABC transporter permease [Candidatus Pacearchaeota archaeon]|nr:ABC transporter permease [Candidatus Pacearchaeota archaeon]HPR79952.1 ABC transporter permease [Candidatus Pacearchaeota archaeon]
MNKIFIQIKSAFSSLMRQRSRTTLTIIAVAIGIASLITMIAAGNGLKAMVLKELEAYGSDMINIEVRVPGKGATGSSTSFATGTTITTFKNSDAEKIGKVDNVELLYTYITGQEIIKYQGEAKSTMIFGYGANAPLIEKIPIDVGRFYSVDEEESISSVIVLGSKIKDDLFGDDDAIDKTVYVRGKPFKVVGVLKERGATFGMNMDSIVYIPTLTMQKKLLGTDYIIGLSVKVNDVNKINETKDELTILMRELHNINSPDEDDFEVMTMADAQTMVGTVLSAITMLLAVIAAVSLVVGGVGITNIMYVSVIERTFEVGLRRAVGAKKNDILWQFLLEASILTFLGGLLGVIIGMGVSFLIYYVAVSFGLDWTYAVSPFSIILSLLFSAIIGMFFGVYPAQKAANMDPINALRQE